MQNYSRATSRFKRTIGANIDCVPFLWSDTTPKDRSNQLQTTKGTRMYVCFVYGTGTVVYAQLSLAIIARLLSFFRFLFCLQKNTLNLIHIKSTEIKVL
jgi:hypothetical protein